MRRHCEEIGHPHEEIERTAPGTIDLAPEGRTVEEVIGLCRELNDAGIQHLILDMPNVHAIRPLETFGEKIIPAVTDL